MKAIFDECVTSGCMIGCYLAMFVANVRGIRRLTRHHETEAE